MRPSRWFKLAFLSLGSLVYSGCVPVHNIADFARVTGVLVIENFANSGLDRGWENACSSPYRDSLINGYNALTDKQRADFKDKVAKKLVSIVFNDVIYATSTTGGTTVLNGLGTDGVAESKVLESNLQVTQLVDKSSDEILYDPVRKAVTMQPYAFDDTSVNTIYVANQASAYSEINSLPADIVAFDHLLDGGAIIYVGMSANERKCAGGAGDLFTQIESVVSKTSP